MIFFETLEESVSPKYGRFVKETIQNTDDTISRFINNSGNQSMVFFEGYSGYILEKNKSNQIISKTYTDNYDQSIYRINHFTRCIYEYNTKGYIANYTYVDTNNKPCAYKNHFLCEINYDEDKVHSKKYYSLEKKTCIVVFFIDCDFNKAQENSHFFEFINDFLVLPHSTSDLHWNIEIATPYELRISCYDQNDKATISPEGYHSCLFTCNKKKDKYSIEYFDTNGKKCINKYLNYSSKRIEFHRNKDKIVEYFFINNKHRKHEHVEQVVTTEVSENGKTCTVSYRKGNKNYSYPFYTKKVYYINDNTQIDKYMMFDDKNKRFISTRGYSGEIIEYDEKSNISRRIFIDENDQKTTTSDGASVLQYQNFDNKLTIIEYYDEINNPCSSKHGFVSLLNGGHKPYSLTSVSDLDLYHPEVATFDFNTNNTSNILKSKRNNFYDNK